MLFHPFGIALVLLYICFFSQKLDGDANSLDKTSSLDAPPRKRGRKRRKLNNIACDSDGTNSESFDNASGGDEQQENGDVHMDSIRMTDDYKIISKLREKVCHTNGFTDLPFSVYKLLYIDNLLRNICLVDLG